MLVSACLCEQMLIQLITFLILCTGEMRPANLLIFFLLNHKLWIFVAHNTLLCEDERNDLVGFTYVRLTADLKLLADFF